MSTYESLTAAEYPFPPGQTLVSTTDRHGTITYANQAFIEVSGFHEHELIGAPHKLIRHAEMPKEIFRDMWATISTGEPWSGVLKNRRKDGSFYWVTSCVTPLMCGQDITGYMSIRTQPSRPAIAKAEQLYQTMLSQQYEGTVRIGIRNGYVTHIGVGGAIRALGRAMKPGAPAIASSLTGLGAYCATLFGPGEIIPEMVTVAAFSAACYVIIKTYEHIAWHKPLLALAGFAKRVCAGQVKAQVDLPTKYTRVGAMQAPLATLNVILLSLIQDSRTECTSMLSDTQKLRTLSERMADRATSQATRIEQTAASMEELSATVAQTAGAAQHATVLTRTVQASAAEGANSVKEINTCLDKLNEAGLRIRGITDLIEGIAFQTNILALNAAIEAARAGEHGRGFSVVATEVRTLAKRTNEASKEIQTLIDAMAATAQASYTQTQKAHTQLDGAMQQLNQVTTLISEIGHASAEQTKGLALVHTAVTEMDQLVHGSAQLSNQVHVYAERIHGEGERVLRSIQTFHAAT